jgi:uncharacterized membrane protein YqjE
MSCDELQSLWQQMPGERERQGALLFLVRERGSIFKRQVRSQNLLGYVVGLLSPIMLLAWIIDDAWIRWGGGLFFLSAIGIAFEVWWFYRGNDALLDASLRDHAGALLRAYDRRLAFWRWMYCTVVPLQIVGAAALVMSLPDPQLRWILGAVAALGLIAAFLVEKRRVSDLRRKSEELSTVLRVLDAPTPM